MGQALGCVQVQESNVAVMEKCGQFKDVLKPGYHCVPWCLGYNLDDVFVTVIASVQYRSGALKEEEKEKAKNAFYNLQPTTAKAQIRGCVLDVIRERVTKYNLEAAFEETKEIAGAVDEKLKETMSPYGYEIVQTLILDIDPDVKVKTAMNDKYAAAIKNMEATEKAKADAESKKQSGVGIAEQRKAIVDGLKDSVLAFIERVPGTTGKEVMDMELVTQYFDTMKEMGTSSKASHVFILHGPDAVKDIAAELRDNILQRNDSNK